MSGLDPPQTQLTTLTVGTQKNASVVKTGMKHEVVGALKVQWGGLQ